jgi:hypothetical protein
MSLKDALDRVDGKEGKAFRAINKHKGEILRYCGKCVSFSDESFNCRKYILIKWLDLVASKQCPTRITSNEIRPSISSYDDLETD